MRSSPLLALAAVAALAGCASEAPETTEQVDLLLYTPACEPEFEPEFQNATWNPSGLTLSWDVLCTRDDAPVEWFALKVSRWDDRADDLWNVWFLDPDRRAVTYGEGGLPGAELPENPSAPDAEVRVPARELEPGDYRIEVWAVPGTEPDATTAEARLTVLDPSEVQ